MVPSLLRAKGFGNTAGVEKKLSWHDRPSVAVDQSETGQVIKHVWLAVNVSLFASLETRLDRVIVQTADVCVLP